MSNDDQVLSCHVIHPLLNTIKATELNPAITLQKATARLADFITREKYFVFVARDDSGAVVGFIALYESHALYSDGAFGTIPELYVRSAYRAHHLGLRLVEQAKSFGLSRGWTRLKVTTPPLPQFDRTLAFYEREGFTISGGRKLKVSL